jgi:asparagine synthase (glutamine-hydrolysing)
VSELEITVGLGHRRLSIVDLSPMGHQPMCSLDGRHWIVFNGEIYNYLDLRKELEALGIGFVSHSDTEVLIAAFREWGVGCLSRLNGMFAFLIYDTQTQSVFAARDRFGVKPLYYRISKDCISFSSEIKQFTVLPDWQAEMNRQRVYDFLNWGIIDHTDETLFNGVYQVRAGFALELDLKPYSSGLAAYKQGEKLHSFPWYVVKGSGFEGSFEEASQEFYVHLVESVALRLRSDVPIGSCLSGGLDSSSIVCIANALLRTQKSLVPQMTFSACSDIKRFDERKWIDVVVEATGVDAYFVTPRLNSLFDELPIVTWHQDEPFGSSSIYAQWNVFRLASIQHIKVMLDGQGADEYLAGYHSFFGPHLHSLFRTLQWHLLIKEIGAMRRIHGYSYKAIAEHFANSAFPEWIKDKLRLVVKRTVARPNWINIEKLGCNPVNPFNTNSQGESDSVRSLSIAQLTSSNLQMLLHWEDRNSMAHSIESRVPFLDYRLVEFTLGLPDTYKIFGGRTKRILRRGLVNILPEAITNRMDKLGFVTPEEEWIRREGADIFRSEMLKAIESSNGILRKGETLDMLEEMISGSSRFNFLPWRIISFGQWVKEFNVKL